MNHTGFRNNILHRNNVLHALNIVMQPFSIGSVLVHLRNITRQRSELSMKIQNTIILKNFTSLAIEPSNLNWNMSLFNWLLYP